MRPGSELSEKMHEKQIFTIGHSNSMLEVFLRLLNAHRIDVLVDVRSHPHSRYASQFDQAHLTSVLMNSGIHYIYMGNELGGRPNGSQYYDETGHVIYSKLAESDLFKDGISRLLFGIRSHRVAIMCSEEDPKYCHRRLLVSRVLANYGVRSNHIRGDGRIEVEYEIPLTSSTLPENQQLLFTAQEADAWKSTRSVFRGSRHPSSSDS